MSLFKCKWIENNIGIQTDDLGFTQVDIGKTTYMTERFIMVSQTKQVFYVTNPSNKKWSIILQEKRTPHSDENQILNFDISVTPSYLKNVLHNIFIC